MVANIPKEPAGILKLDVRCLSMELACSTGNEFWLTLIDMMAPVDHIGMTFINAFSSSTCSIVHRLHGSEANPSSVMSSSGFLMMQALFRNLQRLT